MYHFWSLDFNVLDLVSGRVVSWHCYNRFLSILQAGGVCEFVFSVIVTIDLGLDENIYGLGPT